MEVIQPEDHAHVMAAWTGLLAGGEFKVEYRIRRPDGEIRWIRNRAIPIHDSEGKVYRIAGIAEDITARRLSEIQLGEAQKAAEAADQVNSIVFDTALDAIITIDSQSVITAWNLQAETMFRWDRTEVVGMRLDQTIIPEKQWDAHRNEIEKFLKTGDGPLLNKVAELVAIRRDGREFPVEIAITPAWTNDECTFTAFIRDITVRKQADVDLRQARDAAEAANRAKSEFLANMSHEIRTPLNGVIGMSGLLLDTALDEKQRHFAELIKTSGESLADLINDILDFSKIEARKLEIESLDFDLYAAIEDVAEMMLIKASQKGLDLACLTMPDVPRRVKGDCQRVKQILINLINNAIKFTESGSISARLTLEKQTEAHLSVRFSVTDTGIGIPADRLDRLFKSFSQVDASTTRNYGGTGLGLAISKQLTELMGGSIGVESTVGRGSTFWFTIKLAPASYRREPGRAASIDSRELRALAAHADLEMREILGSQLCSWGLEASMASTGDEVLRMLFDAVAKGHPFNVALIDTELHDIDTLELGKAIKAHSEIAATVLVALLPINCDVELLNLREAGFSSHLLKPVRQSRLFDSIMDAIASTSEPKEVAAKPLPILSKAAIEHGHIVPQSLRILLAEDNRVNQIVTTEILAKHGYGCDIVCDGKKAVESALTGNYDLVLMDCSMPLMDGFEATRKIRAAQANSAQHIPIIALTANAINGDRERCFEAGMDEYLSKPIDPNRLINAVKNWAKSVSTTPNQTEIETSTVIPAKPSNLPGDPSAPVLIDTLLDRCMGDVEVVSMILNEFEQRTAVDLAEIKQCIEKVDCEGIARVAHALKGASGILAADAVAGVALKLEQMGRKGVLADEQQLLSQLNDEVKRCLDYFPVVREVISKGSKSEVSGNLENANTHR
jgi:PAS domain S-box-containing protein